MVGTNPVHRRDIVMLFVVECARVFHAAGAQLVLCGRDAARLQQVVQELTTGSTETQLEACKYAHTIIIQKLGCSDLNTVSKAFFLIYRIFTF